MDISDIITLDDNKSYLILEKMNFQGKEYLYTVKVDKNDKPTTDYCFFEPVKENDGYSAVLLEDKKIINAFISMLSIKYIAEIDDEQAA